MQSDVSSVAALGAVVSLFFRLAVGIAWLVVALGPVRRVSAQAGSLLAVAAGLGLLLSCVSRAVPFAISELDLEVAQLASAHTFVGLFFGLIDAVLATMSIAAVAQLANAMRRDPRDPAPPR